MTAPLNYIQFKKIPGQKRYRAFWSGTNNPIMQRRNLELSGFESPQQGRKYIKNHWEDLQGYNQ